MAIVAALVVACMFVAARPAYAATTFTVDTSSLGPGNDNYADVACTFEEAINASNASPDHDTIHFDLAGPGVKVFMFQQ